MVVLEDTAVETCETAVGTDCRFCPASKNAPIPAAANIRTAPDIEAILAGSDILRILLISDIFPDS